MSFELACCDRCGEQWNEPATGIPQFSEEARAAGVSLGGLLRLHPAQGAQVRYVGSCPAGAFAMDVTGALIWIADWGYLVGLVVDGTRLELAGRSADINTGKLL